MRFRPLFTFALLCCIPASSGLASSWAGEEVLEEGKSYVRNPAGGMLPPMTVGVEEVWRLGGYSDAPEEFFGVIGDVVVDEENNFFVLDSQLSEVRVFDEGGNFLRTIGREGEGPGEFRRPQDLSLMPSGMVGVVQPFPSRVVMLSPEGDPVGNLPFEPQGKGFSSISAVSSAGDRLAVVYSVMSPGEKSFVRTSKLALVEEAGTTVVDLLEEESSMDNATSLCIEKDWNGFERAWSTSPDGNVYARLDFTRYQVGVWGPDGEMKHVIEREFEPLERTKSEKQEIQARWEAGIRRWVQNPQFEIEDAWNPIESIHGRDDGTVWVRTSEGTRGLSEGELARFDVFDDQGRYVRQIVMPGEFDVESDGMFLSGGYVIVVTDLVSARDAMRGGGVGEEEGEAEPMEIIAYRMDLSSLAQAD